MATDIYSKQANERSAPILGFVSSINVNTTGNAVDLTTVGPNSWNASNSTMIPTETAGITLVGCMNRYVTFEAVGCTVGLAFAAANSNTLSNINTANTGINGVGVCFQLVPGVVQEWMIHPDSRWMGYIAASGTGQLIIAVSSRGM